MMAEAGTPTQAARAQSRAASCCHPVEDTHTEGKWSAGGSLESVSINYSCFVKFVNTLLLELYMFQCDTLLYDNKCIITFGK